MLQSKSSSINLARVSAKRKDPSAASIDKKSSFAGTRGGAKDPLNKPVINASNNVNGDELLKVHGAEGGFHCE